jgi:hypothetical protein
MSGDELEQDDVLGRVRMDRRGFVTKLAVGAAFASPVVASFAMSGTAFGTESRSAYSSYLPEAGDHAGHRGYGPYAYNGYGYDLDPG